MMKIGTRISPDWLDRPGDLAFLKQIGVAVVNITMDICPGYNEAGGRANRDGLTQVAEAIDKAGLKVERANTLNSHFQKVFLGQEGADYELESAQINAELCGEFGFPVMGIQCFQAGGLGTFPKPIHERVTNRDGSSHLRMDLIDALKDQPPPEGAPTHDELWERTLRIFGETVPVAESNGVKLAMHGNDPPVPALYGVPQILYNFDAFDRLFSEVDSPANCMTFCVGTRYESGEDIFEGIRRFGHKIVHVHFRNVHGTIPANQGYEEVFPDRGDLDMYQVVRALHEVGYEGAIDYDHIMGISTDTPVGREYIAFCVGHARGMLQGLANSR